jgi:hypothetical protein
VIAERVIEGARAFIELPHVELDLLDLRTLRPDFCCLHKGAANPSASISAGDRNVFDHNVSPGNKDRDGVGLAYGGVQDAHNLPLQLCDPYATIVGLDDRAEICPGAGWAAGVTEDVGKCVSMLRIDLSQDGADPFIVLHGG